MAITPAPHVLSSITVTNLTGSQLPIGGGMRVGPGATRTFYVPFVQIQEELVPKLNRLVRAQKVTYSLSPGHPYDIGTAGGDVAMQNATIMAARRAVARAVCPANVSLTAMAVNGSVTDGIAVTAGQVVLLINQTVGTQNGPWVVGTVSGGTARLSRPAWWASGSVVAPGFQILVDSGTLFALSTFVPVAPSGVVDSADPFLAPQVYQGTATLNGASPSVATVTFKGMLLGGLGAVAVVTSTSTAIAVKAVLSGFAATNGTLTITGPNGATDVVNYIVRNTPT